MTKSHQDQVCHGTTGAQGGQKGVDVAKVEATFEWPLCGVMVSGGGDCGLIRGLVV